MEATGPKCYIFKEDIDVIKELVLFRPNEETGGDLFGLWTTDDEPVLHIVTGQGRQMQHTPQQSSSKNGDSVAVKLKKLDEMLREKFHLSYIGKWQFKRRSEQNEMLIIEAAGGQAFLSERARHAVDDLKDFVLIMGAYDNVSKQLELSPYFLSRFSIVTKGKIEILPEERVFRKVKEIRQIVDELVEKGDLRDENQSKGSEDQARGDQDHSKRKASPTTCDVDMKDVSSSHPFACNQRDFKVYLFKEDIQMMQDLVLRYQNAETGGDLFGLWTSEGDAVIHIVQGPGQNCKRTDVSFFQDVPYLQKNGELLTQDYMLCHIGEWHSHHQLRLCQPSQGDSSTVIRNYPRGTCGFLLIIANIVSPLRRPNEAQVTLSPYLYTANSSNRFDQKGTVSPLPYNAFKKDPKIARKMEEGMEIERRDFHGGRDRQRQPSNNSTCSSGVQPMDEDPPSPSGRLHQKRKANRNNRGTLR